MPILHGWEDDGRHFLLVRRCLDNPSEKAYYFVFAPLGTTLAEMVKAIGARWHIEETFEIGKDTGLADYEVRCWTAWYRHITLVMIVEACLAGICATARMLTPEPSQAEGTPPTCPLLPLTIPEVRHLLAHLRLPSASQRDAASCQGSGGDAAIRAGQASSIPDVAVPSGKARSTHHPYSYFSL